MPPLCRTFTPQLIEATVPEQTPTTIDRMIIAYSVACREAHRFAVGSEPYLWGYVAGWACREIGMADLPRELIGTFRGSWWQGWRDCDACHRIAARHTQDERPDP